MKLILIIVASWATIYAAAAFFLGFEADFKVSFVLAILALGGVFYLDHRAAERERIAHAREVWLNDWDIDELLHEAD
jgi:hypothetical protein